MGENPETPPEEKKADSVDLSSLKDLSLTPDWGSSKGNISISEKKGDRRSGGRAESRAGGQAPRKDRRPPRSETRSFERREDSGDRRNSNSRGPSDGDSRGRGGKRFDKTRPPMFKPTVGVDIYPEDEPFKVLVKAIRSSYRTYELFDIAKLIIEKPERFVAVIRPLSGQETETPLYLSTRDNTVFENEDAAITHVMQHALETMFEVEEVEMDPPSGNFQMVNKCGLTGELLGPPNYHKYQDYLNEHFSTRIHNMPMERYLSKIETVREETVVQEWIAKVSKANRYTLKVDDLPEGEDAPKFYGVEEVRRYIINNKKEELIKKVSTARLPGTAIEKLPEGNIRKSVHAALEHQRKFPLDTANHLRARLRRLNFNIYKKGSKGISFVCVVKRKFRNENTKLAEAAQTLIDFIEKHPNIAASELTEKYLGISLPAAEATPTTSENTAEEGSPTPTPNYTAEQQTSIRSLKQNLRWLITEGYVTEYSDGRLFAPPLSAAPKPKPTPETLTETTIASENKPSAESATPIAKTSPEDASLKPEAKNPSPEPSLGTVAESPTEPVAEVPNEAKQPSETENTEPKAADQA